MNILVNGESKTLQEGLNTLSQALEALGYTLDMPMAIAVNQSIIHRSKTMEVLLNAGDEIEILMPMQGG